MAHARVVVKVPASTSNLGPGFDCLGVALELWNEVEILRLEKGARPHGMVAETAEAFFARWGDGAAQFPFEVRITGDIPVSRGLGSSVSVRLGVLLGLAELARGTMAIPREEILELLIELEGHPDNAVASCLGGLAICSPAGRGSTTNEIYTRVPIGPELAFVVLIPDFKISTEVARGLLPKEISLQHAVENSQRTARIAAALCLKDYASLRGLFIDHFHQPYRQKLIPGFAEIIQAGTDAGALGGFLSGAGSSLMALTLESEERVARAMLDEAQKHGFTSRTAILRADNQGAQVLDVV